MGKITQNLQDRTREEEYSNSNSEDVRQSAGEAVISLEPPPLQFSVQGQEDGEEEEVRETIVDEKVFEIPIDGGSDAEDGSDDNPANSESDPPFDPSNIAQVKEKFEQTFQYDLSDTQVNSNSSLPADFGANAFTRGNEIHLGPGQERHLSHEMAHVVQQKQGKVTPTSSQNGVPINEEPALEEEADKMSFQAMQFKKGTASENTSSFQYKPAFNGGQTYQFNKPENTEPPEGKVAKKVGVIIPNKKIMQRDFKYVEATLNLATGADVTFFVDESLAHLPDEVAVGDKGLAVKKEGPNLVSKEIEQKINLEIKDGVEVNSFGGKVGVECKLGEKSLFSGMGLEFSFVDVNWSETNPLDKIKFLTTTFKAPEFTHKIPFQIAGEPHTLVAKCQLQGELQPSKTEILKKIVSRFGHLFAGEVAIAGGMVLAGAATITAALYTIYMGKEMEERVEILLNQILEFGKGFKGGYTGKGKGGSGSGYLQGLNARQSAYKKMPAAVFDEKIQKEGMGSAFSDAMYKAVQNLKHKAIEQFKKEHDVDEDSWFKGDLTKFKRRVGYLCESKYLRDRLSEI